MTKKIIGLLGVALSCCALATGCSSSHSESSDNANSNEMVDNKSYKLAYFETTANSDLDHQYYSLGFYKDGRLVKKICKVIGIITQKLLFLTLIVLMLKKKIVHIIFTVPLILCITSQ